jgi:hypothetical protein
VMTEEKGGDGTETGKEFRNALDFFKFLVYITLHNIPYYVVIVTSYGVFRVATHHNRNTILYRNTIYRKTTLHCIIIYRNAIP